MKKWIKKLSKVFIKRGALAWIPDATYIKIVYFLRMKKILNIKNPKTFNEKLQWLKLYDRNPLYTRLVDKHEVKKYVADMLGAEYIIPTLGIYDSFDEIDFEKLPERFVLKCTHDSGSTIICRNAKTWDRQKAGQKIKKQMKDNYYYVGREWPYKNVKPRIIVEEYLDNTPYKKDIYEKNQGLVDYKFYCFNGEPTFTLVCIGRFSKEGLQTDVYDREWNHMDLKRSEHSNSGIRVRKPENYEKMLNIAKTLSQNIPFARIDLYELNGKVYFGEITFYPTSGFEGFNPEEWDYILGDWLKLK